MYIRERCFVERCQPKDTTITSVAFHPSYPLSASCSDGYPGQHRAKVAEFSTFGRPAKLRSLSWWIRYFVQTSLEENEAATKKFEQAATKRSYKPACQVFHLKSYR
ncbi:probable pectin methylesterase CGR3 [Rhododendron vialii]|uniref:probable pectin methylesterase CGR3 n=1 Tax=Rhododendron vialii TaxID=182163 RepID=UPI00265E5F52|nr:probable pectin methylesterase CGR3 [Rhododendron vialii]